VIEGVRRAMRATYNRELDFLDAHLPFLASVGSVSPYVGLFGTVWGIMNAFRGLANVAQATLAQVAPGIAEALRAASLGKTPMAMLSRGVAGIRRHTLIVNLPGSPKAVAECLEVLLPVLPECPATSARCFSRAEPLLACCPCRERALHPSPPGSPNCRI